ncbi:isoprenoid biosynthesis glyoxalase ElbB [Psychromonas ossibalaenae]|uniref:isoprenoid biosynthesis glyoxalase ElbB n=1 Tax=Psychromonas ossibalaenae TaxID=444922 RepID=UPI00035D71CC|nr:isoprenoid biosynthesis glyoxalase ElbB [Psychromonas ossibalaenae]
MKNKVAVILAGCGVYDGSEINEVVLTLLALEEQGAAYQCFSPDINLYHVIDHLSGQEVNQVRNTLSESARIVRGRVKALTELQQDEFDALIVTGGFGVAKNLSNYAVAGCEFSINEQFAEVMRAFRDACKPAGYMCIAPVLLPKIYDHIQCTIGEDPATAEVINSLGGRHVSCAVNDIVVDQKHKVVTTPAYMLADGILSAKGGIDKLAAEVISLVNT